MGGSWRVRLVGLVAAAAVLAGVVSVGPAGAQSGEGYADVVGTTHEEDITALDALGVFDRTGCDEGFCPGAPLKRWTMAVWMVRVLDGEEPPAVTSTRFSDVDAQQWWAAHVERFAELGVTRGYGDDTFRPDQSVTRAQMAAFLTRAFDLPNADDAGFSDIEGNTHYDAINAFAASGITHGYGDGTFRPGVATTRGQMAAFFTRSASLLVAQGRYAAVSAGGEHTCARRADSTIECWGNNGSGQTDAPEGQFNAVSAGGEHTCARRADSTIACWGNNESGQTSPRGTIQRSVRWFLAHLRSAAQHHRMLGQQRCSAKPIPPRDNSAQCPLVPGTPAVCAPTAPSNAGVTLNGAKPIPPRDNSAQCPLVPGTPAVCAPPRRLCAGVPIGTI